MYEFRLILQQVVSYIDLSIIGHTHTHTFAQKILTVLKIGRA